MTEAHAHPTAPVKLGFFGCGFIAAAHAALLQDCGESYEIVRVFDPDRARAETFAAQWGSRAADSEAEVLAACDAVFLCTWTSEHRRLTEAAAAAGRHIFCEKPLAFDAADAAAMVDCVESAGVANVVGLVLRSTPAMAALRQAIAGSDSGRPMNIVFRDDQFIPIQGMYQSDWRGDRTRAGRGTLLEHSIHDLDMLEWLMGPIVRIAATQNFYHGIDGIEDSVAVLVRFASGAGGTLTSVWHDITSRPSSRRLEVFCERALYTLENEWFGPLQIERIGANGEEHIELGGDQLNEWLSACGAVPEWPHRGFLEAIRRGRAASPNFAEALRAHQLADAAYRSAESDGTSVDIALPQRAPQ